MPSPRVLCLKVFSRYIVFFALLEYYLIIFNTILKLCSSKELLTLIPGSNKQNKGNIFMQNGPGRYRLSFEIYRALNAH